MNNTQTLQLIIPGYVQIPADCEPIAKAKLAEKGDTFLGVEPGTGRTHFSVAINREDIGSIRVVLRKKRQYPDFLRGKGLWIAEDKCGNVSVYDDKPEANNYQWLQTPPGKLHSNDPNNVRRGDKWSALAVKLGFDFTPPEWEGRPWTERCTEIV